MTTALLGAQIANRLYGCPADLACRPCRQAIGLLAQLAQHADELVNCTGDGTEAADGCAATLAQLHTWLAAGEHSTHDEGGSSQLCVCPANDAGGPHAWYCPTP